MPFRSKQSAPLRLQIARAALSAVLSAAPLAQAQQPAPDAPTIRYSISTETLAAALTAEGLPAAPDRLSLAVPLSSTAAAPHLRIAAAELTPANTLRLRLVCRNPGECMPFFATLTMPDHAAALTAIAALRPSTPATHSVPAAITAPPRGITVGARVTLQLTDAQMRIQLPAVAIDTGTTGTEVRVASLDRKHTYRGVVVDADTVRGGVQ